MIIVITEKYNHINQSIKWGDLLKSKACIMYFDQLIQVSTPEKHWIIELPCPIQSTLCIYATNDEILGTPPPPQARKKATLFPALNRRTELIFSFETVSSIPYKWQVHEIIYNLTLKQD